MQVLVAKDGSELTVEPGARILPREAYADWVAAEELLAHARGRVRGWRERAAGEYQRQVARGREEGRAAGEEERIAAILEFSQAAVAEIRALEASLEEVAAQAVREAFGMVPGRKRLRAMVQRLLNEVSSEQSLRLSVHPQERSLVAEILAEEAFADYDVRLVGDPDCAPDSARIDAATGVVETSLERMLAGLERFRKVR